MSISQVPDAVLVAQVFPFLTTPELAKTAGISKQLNKASCLDAAWKNREPSHKGPKQENHSWKQHVILIHDPYFQIMNNAEEQHHNYVAHLEAAFTGIEVLQGLATVCNRPNPHLSLWDELVFLTKPESFEFLSTTCKNPKISALCARNVSLCAGLDFLLIATPLAVANFHWDKNKTDNQTRRKTNLVGGAALIALGALSNFLGGDEETSALCISAGSCFVMKGILPRQWLYPNLGKVVGTVQATSFWALAKGKSLALGLKRKLFG